MKNNIHETASLWTDLSGLRHFPTLESNANVDVCVIGGGISGLTTAYLLSKNFSTILIDDGPIGGGQTSRTTAHITNVLDDRYFNLENYFGTEGAKLAAESHRAAIDFIKNLVKEYKIECQFQEVDAYLFGPPDDNSDILEKEFAAALRVGFSEIKRLERAPLNFNTGPCLCFPKQAQFDPLPYLSKLCDLIFDRGGLIYTQTHASNIQQNGVLYTITTDRGKTIQAKHVIVATNSPINNRFFPHLKQAAYRTYVIGSEIPKGTVQKGLYYDTLNPYHYVRIANGEDGREFLIVGGEDHRIGEAHDFEERYKSLENWAKARFSEMKKVTYKWSGEVLEPVDSLAFIGRTHPDSEVYIITGDSGNGITHGTLAGILIQDLIQKRANNWEKIYDPHRKQFKAAYEFTSENLNTAWQYTDWLTPGEIESAESLMPNSGAIIRKGLKKCAVYKDENGNIHEMSAVCPHLGAIVRWNSSEHCWECPAHGSCFDAKGVVTQGPANENLTKTSENIYESV